MLGQPFTVATENEDVVFRLFTPTGKTDQWHKLYQYRRLIQIQTGLTPTRPVRKQSVNFRLS